jgi:hypothetical protein
MTCLSGGPLSLTDVDIITYFVVTLRRARWWYIAAGNSTMNSAANHHNYHTTLKVYEMLVQVRIESDGAEHKDVAATYECMAVVLKTQGRVNDAIEMCVGDAFSLLICVVV